MGNAIYRKTSISSTPTDYQQWENYPDSPVLTSDYPYQYIYDTGADPLLETAVYLFGFDVPAYIVEDSGYQFIKNTGSGFYAYIAADVDPNAWYIDGMYYFTPDIEAAYGMSENLLDILKEANADIYTDNTFTNVYFAKTTNETSVSSNIRVRNLRHKTSISSQFINQQWASYPQTPEYSFIFNYQCIIQSYGIYYLVISTSPIKYFTDAGMYYLNPTDTSGANISITRYLEDATWNPDRVAEPFNSLFETNAEFTFIESNHDIYDNLSIVFAKTIDLNNGSYIDTPIMGIGKPSIFTDSEYAFQLSGTEYGTGNIYLFPASSNIFSFQFTAFTIVVYADSNIHYYMWDGSAWVDQGITSGILRTDIEDPYYGKYLLYYFNNDGTTYANYYGNYSSYLRDFFPAWNAIYEADETSVSSEIRARGVYWKDEFGDSKRVNL